MSLRHLKVDTEFSTLGVIALLLLVTTIDAVFTIPDFNVVDLLLSEVAEIRSALRMHPTTVDTKILS
jgi:hypothetical protein